MQTLAQRRVLPQPGTPAQTVSCKAARSALRQWLPRAAASASATGIASDAGLESQRLYLSEEPLPSITGPVQAVRLAGNMGRGLETTKTVAIGQLLFISAPLAIVRNDADGGDWGEEQQAGEDDEADEELVTDAEFEQLQQQVLQSAQSPRTQAWLELLDDGTPERLSQLPDLRHLSSLDAGPSTSTSTAINEPSAEWEQHAADVLDLNLHLQASEDVALSLAMGLEPKRAVGLWPEHALLNHSCIPNISRVVFKGRMFVHAARPIGKQGQLLTSYLPGPQLMAPLGVRQQALKEQHGFMCSCPRCKDEERQDRNLTQMIADVHEAVTQQLGPDLAVALEMGDEEAVSVVSEQLRMYVEVLDAAFTKLGVREQSQIWLQVSVFPLYELLAGALSALGESDPRLLELLTALAASVEPGGEQHLYWSRQFRAEVQAEQGHEDMAFRHADKQCFNAHIARYGQGLSRSLYARVLAAAAEAEDGGEDDDEQQEAEKSGNTAAPST